MLWDALQCMCCPTEYHKYKFVKTLLHLLLISKIWYQSSVPLHIELLGALFYISLVNYLTMTDLWTTANHSANNF